MSSQPAPPTDTTYLDFAKRRAKRTKREADQRRRADQDADQDKAEKAEADTSDNPA